MKLMIKVLMLIGLISGIVSCKLYDEILDKVEDSLKGKDRSPESNEVSVKSSDGRKDDIKNGMQDSGRSGHGAGSLNDAGEGVQKERAGNRGGISEGKEIEQSVNDPKDEVVVKNLDDSGLKEKQINAVVNQHTNEIKESEDIKKQAESRLEEVAQISRELGEIKTKLDGMKGTIDAAYFYLESARKNGNVPFNRQRLPILDGAIKKVKTGRTAVEQVEYNAASLALMHAKNSFSGAFLGAENVLREIASDHPFIWSYYSSAKKSMESAEDMLKKVMEYKDKLNSRMEQVEKDFAELEGIYKQFKN
ncbi:hypothetical protein [Borrelia sp. RT5S]|uniref:hypothetical protein n=1 Tax=Borrelia sp. RT5S TaxID=2898581 RepID=UPI001E2E829F|nr:hypothetical protein [Borrelia sp. RT5S]UGQ16643.1 hypothetical protein LSO06_04830 [Borrelia sp. RT5S]